MAGSVYAQLASFFFLFAAIFSDILLIRFVLVLGNLLLMLNGILGLPKWPNPISPAWPDVAIDVVVWSGVSLLLHVYALSCLLIDEKSVRRFPEDSCESIYQFFHRRSGISRRDFLPILNEAKWLKVPTAGTDIPTAGDFHLVVEGFVNGRVEGLRRREDDPSARRDEALHFKLHSGNMFDMRFANIFKVPVGFLNTSFQAVSGCDNVVILSWPVAALERFAAGPPARVQAWRNIIAFCLADIAHRPLVHEPNYMRHPDFAIETVPAEPARNRCRRFFHWILHSMNPRPPQGLRHRPLPVMSLQCKYPTEGSGSSVHPA